MVLGHSNKTSVNVGVMQVFASQIEFRVPSLLKFKIASPNSTSQMSESNSNCFNSAASLTVLLVLVQ